MRPGESSNEDSPKKGDTSPSENDSGAGNPAGQGTHMILVSSVDSACHIFGREVRYSNFALCRSMQYVLTV